MAAISVMLISESSSGNFGERDCIDQVLFTSPYCQHQEPGLLLLFMLHKTTTVHLMVFCPGHPNLGAIYPLSLIFFTMIYGLLIIQLLLSVCSVLVV